MVLAMVFFVGGISQADLNDGLVAYYPFNGNANDESGNGNNGIVFGPTLTTDRFGNVDSAYSFDGVNDYIHIGNDPIFDIHNEITISVWVKKADFDSPYPPPIISKWKTGYPATAGSWVMGENDGGYQVCQISGNGVGGSQAISDVPIVPDSFYHIVGLYSISDNTVRVFINGNEEGTAIGRTGSIFVSDAKIYIGALKYDVPGWIDKYFAGVIDDIRIYNRALSPSEILELYIEDGGGANFPPIAIAGTSLDGNNMLQLDGILSSDPNNDPLTFSWQIEGETTPRLGQIVSVEDLAVGDYTATLTVSDDVNTSTDTMLLGIPESIPPVTDVDGDLFSPEDGDCNDNDATINPDATEVCDEIDNNCDGQIDEGFDADGDGFTQCGGDCNDTNPSINPTATEFPGNEIDENCDGSLGNCDPNATWKNHGQYVRCVAQEVDALVASGVVTEEEGNVLVSSAAESDIGK